MSALLAIGLGCRRNCSGAALTDLVTRALRLWPVDVAQPARRVLFSVEDKRGEAGLGEAAETLGLDLVFLPREALQGVMERVATRSRRVEDLIGLASVAEASALAGAGVGSTLVVPRLCGIGSTCALAVAGDAP
jgi:cobalt-precorrin 5A hydrolase